MGSYIEINDTLRITKEQGFPKELDIQQHKNNPYKTEDFENKIFEFEDKPNIRVYHAPPVRVFLVEYLNEKWLYWGLVHIIKVNHNMIEKTTSGKYKIIKIYTIEEMKKAHELVDGNVETDYFN